MEPDDALELALALGRLSTALTRQIDRPVAGHHGLSLGDVALLAEVARAGGRVQRAELAERLGITPSGVARQLAPLERIGVVARESHPTDARLVLVVLTEAGAQLVADATATAAEAAARALDSRWSRPQQQRLAELVDAGRRA